MSVTGKLDSPDEFDAFPHHQSTVLSERTLTPEEMEKLTSDRVLVSDFKQQKLETDAQKNWDLFYKRNTTNFFKDRHWTTREFDELKNCREVNYFARICCSYMFKFVWMSVALFFQSQGQKLVLLEAGCGVGNCIFPLLEEDLSIFIYACDFSPRAVEFVKVKVMELFPFNVKGQFTPKCKNYPIIYSAVSHPR